MGKPGGLSRRLGEEKSGIETDFCNEGQLSDLKNDNVGEKDYVEDVGLEDIDVATWAKKNSSKVVSQEHKLEVLC